jgi:hypothetical protein
MNAVMNYVYYFHVDMNDALTDRVIEWCLRNGGEINKDWALYTKVEELKVGVQFEEKEVATLFELSFDIRPVKMGDEVVLKYINP